MKKQNSIYWKCITGYDTIKLLKALCTRDIIIQHKGKSHRLIDSKNFGTACGFSYQKEQIDWVRKQVLKFGEYFVIRTH